MQKMNKKSFRATIALTLVIVAGCFVWAGVPALAADNSILTASQNANPIAENLEFNTFRNIAIHGSLSAKDPDGDAVTFEIAEKPEKGTVQTEKDGRFVYTPLENKKGKDSFTYIAIDSNGNMSNKAVVTITINKQATKITYSDMLGNSAHYAALVLADKGVLIGEKLGNEYFFRPDAAVTRGEFVAMCMAMSNSETLQGITRTGFYDDDSIPMWAKPYVSTALMSGLITGYKNDEGRIVFASQEPITFAEAAVILDNILNITDVVSVAAMEPSICPVWSYQAEANLAACQIMPAMGTECITSITRAEAANILVAAMEFSEDRDGKTSLLSWAK